MTHKMALLLLGGAAALAAVACDDARTASGSNRDLTPPNAADPNADIVVTNTNAKVAVVPDPFASAENRDHVREYPDETRFAQAKPARMITGFATAVRESPSGDAITTLTTTENVSEVARDAHGDYYLVVYPDPKDQTKHLAGWVYKDALENYDWSAIDTSSPGGAPLSNTMALKLGCAGGESHLRTDRDFCGKACKSDDDCDSKKTGARCDGLAFQVNEKANQLSNASYCVAPATAPNPATTPPPSGKVRPAAPASR